MNDSENESRAASDSLAAFVDRIALWMPQLCQAMIRHEQNHIATGHLNLPQAWALEALAEGPRTMRDLADRLHLKSSTNTLFVDRLEVLGYVRRRRHAADRRTVHVELTPLGRRTIQQLRAQKREGMLMLFRPFTPRERAQYLILIEKLVRGLSEDDAAKSRRTS
jgi:DNA-binding MarR family transcriptional regulator